jgi:histone H2A
MSGKGAKGLSGKGAKGTMGDKKGDKKKPVSRSARAGLQFPVGRIHRLLKAGVACCSFFKPRVCPFDNASGC